MGRLSGKVAFVTGAASGIGAACALRFAQEGAAIAGMDLNKAAGGDWDAAVKLAPAPASRPATCATRAASRRSSRP